MRLCVSAMACCLGTRREQCAQTGAILDVEEIIQDYVWNFFKSTRPTWQQVCFRRRDFEIEVPMNYFHFDKLREDVRPRQTLEPSGTSLAPSQPRHPALGPRDVSRSALETHANVMALSTEFSNRTDRDQTYRFRFEKTRKASLNVTFQRGYTVGGKVNFTLGLPKIASSANVGGEVDMHLAVTRATGETIEETLTWEATSEINVAKTSNYTAMVLLSEVPVSYNFQLWTKMTMPQGAAPVTVRRRLDRTLSSDTRHSGESFRYTHVVSDLKMVFDKYKDLVQIIKEPTPSRESFTYAVVFKTSGIIEGVRLSDQKILLDGRELGVPRRSSFPGGLAAGGAGGGGGGSGYGTLRGGPHHGGDFASGFPPPASFLSSDMTSSPVGFPGDGFAVSPSASHHAQASSPSTALPLPLPSSSSTTRAGRLHGLGSPHSPPPAPIPIIEEMPEDDGAIEEVGQGVGMADGSVPGDSQPLPPPPHPRPFLSRGPQNCSHGSLPRIVTTTPSSQASSPLSESGSGDLSECSRKSETITTV